VFLKGGSLYYTPISQPINAFDRNLLIEPKKIEHRDEEEDKNENKKQKDNQNSLNGSDLLLSDFDTEFLNLKQSLNLINNFVNQNFLNSEIHVNDLIFFIKDNYSENTLEKQAKLEKLNHLKKHLARTRRFSICFDKIDNEGSGVLQLAYLIDALVNFKDGVFKEQVMKATNSLREQILLNGKPDESINKDEFITYVSTLLNLVDFPKFEDQIYNHLSGIVNVRNIEKSFFIKPLFLIFVYHFFCIAGLRRKDKR
jgi:hypothetical protein